MRRTTPRRLPGVLTGAMLALGLTAACTGGGAPPVAAGGGATAGSTSSAAAATRILDVYTGASGQNTANFNPFTPTPLHGVQGMIYEPLMFFNQAKAGDVQPQLATAYRFADGGRTLTFTLRPGVKWSDGRPLTAEDVAFSFELAKKNPKLNSGINSGGNVMTSVEATGATEVTLKFKEPAYTRLWNIAGQSWIVPRHIWEKIKDPATDPNKNPVGTGPFVLGDFSPQTYVLKKNPQYWETGKPKIAGMRFYSFNGGDAATTALAAGQLDWSGLFMPDIDKQYVAKDPEHNKYKNESFLYVTNLVPNLKKAPFTDVAVRRAVNVALDRKKIIDLAFAGLGKMPNPLGLVLPQYQDYIAPQFANTQLEYDPAKARQILEQAGYQRGADGVYAKDGKRLSITCTVVTGWTDYISTMQIVKQQLKEVGIEFKSKEVSFNAFSAAQTSGDFQMHIWNAWGGPGPYYMYNNILNSANVPPAGQNQARWKNDVVDAALSTIAQTPPEDTEAVKQAIQRIQEQVVAEVPYIPIQQSSALAEFRTLHATGWPSEENPYALALPFYVPDGAIVAKNLVPVP
ncbi:peptide ABC transporter substrate-binding protein [Sphaerisporangium melleum]|uniref:Peptide ABC transporter substrate-binding protein n=1 Tax=Sphaerisporangium melleum TaxID=321316 RepID=A0A917R2L9_9ACTN|nr:ABC transporter substrate-binding protein [Sphaerisporangium melleum]GGK84851.1 peptide ABC transporter substrate-binding protein [Sphaerisporangium melleum]GII70460.1 peptide ABC transporter substrate-binding protein [Sphaerisporangium melleum]